MSSFSFTRENECRRCSNTSLRNANHLCHRVQGVIVSYSLLFDSLLVKLSLLFRQGVVKNGSLLSFLPRFTRTGLPKGWLRYHMRDETTDDKCFCLGSINKDCQNTCSVELHTKDMRASACVQLTIKCSGSNTMHKEVSQQREHI